MSTQPLPDSPKVFKLAELPFETIREGLTRTAVRSDGSIAVANWFEPDFVPSGKGYHSHPFDQLSFAFGGTLIFTIDGEDYTLESGDCIRIPAHAMHAARPAGDSRVLNLDIFAPGREDYFFLAEHQTGSVE